MPASIDEECASLLRLASVRVSEIEQLDAGQSLVSEARALLRVLEQQVIGSTYFEVPSELARWKDRSPPFAALVLALAVSSTCASDELKSLPERAAREYVTYCTRFLLESYIENSASSVQSDVFLKDLAVARLFSYAGAAHVIERRRGWPRRVIKAGGIQQAVRVVHLLARSGLANSPFYELHAQTPILHKFNEVGWAETYAVCAALLEHDKSCLGVIGLSWLFDPMAADISPNLRYLREVPTAGGAYFFRYGSSENDYILATAKSSKRRALAEEGKYTPTSYLMVWHRDDLIRWARQIRSEQHSA